jgi:uncharacterized protein (DUF849 family)
VTKARVRTASISARDAEQVAKVRRIAEELSYEIATPDEAWAILQLKGGASVGF